MSKTALICGAGGFIGTHLASKLKKEGYWVRGVDLKYPEFSGTEADQFIIGDLRLAGCCKMVTQDVSFDEVYQLAADMGGAQFIFTGENDAAIMHNSALINLNMAECCRVSGAKKVFYSSSACIYPQERQKNAFDIYNFKLPEYCAYPANPDSDYGWEKIFSERLYQAYARNYGMNVKIARFHNIFGPLGTFQGGREKAPAALCRKIAMAKDGDEIEIIGDGKQIRTFLYIDECLEGIEKLMESEYHNGPLNIGSEETISIDGLAFMIMDIAGKEIKVKHIPGPEGVRARTSDNYAIFTQLDWKPTKPLMDGMIKTYEWIKGQIEKEEKKG